MTVCTSNLADTTRGRIDEAFLKRLQDSITAGKVSPTDPDFKCVDDYIHQAEVTPTSVEPRRQNHTEQPMRNKRRRIQHVEEEDDEAEITPTRVEPRRKKQTEEHMRDRRRRVQHVEEDDEYDDKDDNEDNDNEDDEEDSEEDSEEDDEEDNKEEESPAVRKQAPTRTFKQMYPNAIPTSAEGKAYKLPEGTSRVSLEYLSTLFAKDREFPLLRDNNSYTASHDCYNGLENDLHFIECMRISAFQHLALLVEGLTPFHHLKTIPQDVVEKVRNLGCFTMSCPSRESSTQPSKKSFTMWCQTHQQVNQVFFESTKLLVWPSVTTRKSLRPFSRQRTSPTFVTLHSAITHTMSLTNQAKATTNACHVNQR